MPGKFAAIKHKKYYLLGIIQLSVGTIAVVSGLKMMFDPDGSNMGISVDRLNFTPFYDFFMPGIMLFVFNGLFNLFTSAFTLMRHKFTARLSFLQGSILTATILLQFHFIGSIKIVEGLLLIIGLAEMYISLFLLRNNARQNQKLNY